MELVLPHLVFKIQFRSIRTLEISDDLRGVYLHMSANTQYKYVDVIQIKIKIERKKLNQKNYLIYELCLSIAFSF